MVFQALGDICLIKIRDKNFAEHILRSHPQFRSVYYQGKISGKLRKPQVEWLAGKKNTITRVRENYCDFIVDISKVMFSKGNQEEKRRVVKQIREGEEVLDMFAGIGYFTIPLARLSGAKKVWAVELNPDAVELLKQNVELNKVLHKVEVIPGDCRTEAEKVGKKFDRILMGYLNPCKRIETSKLRSNLCSFPGTYEFLPAALKVCKQNSVIHFHELAETSDEIEEKVRKIAKDIRVLKATKVKAYGIRLYHWVLDLQAV